VVRTNDVSSAGESKLNENNLSLLNKSRESAVDLSMSQKSDSHRTISENQLSQCSTNGVTSQLIGDLLIQREFITPKDRTQALAMQQEVGGLIGQALLRLGAVTEEKLLDALSQQLDMKVADTLMLPVDISRYPQAAKLLDLPAQWFVDHQVFIWLEADDPENFEVKKQAPRHMVLHVLAADPLNLALRETLESLIFGHGPWNVDASFFDYELAANDHVSAFDEGTNMSASITHADIQEADSTVHHLVIEDIQYHLTSNQTLETCLARLQQQESDTEDDDFTDASRLREMAEEAPVIDFVNNLFAVALKDNASDIHIEAFEHAFQVRYRIDGVLHTRQNQSRSRFDAVASRIKLIAGMDIAERRLPQDGRHTIRFAGNDIDLRISSVPSTWGESIVMRLLRKQAELPDLEGLGLMGRSGYLLDEILAMPNGVFLVTGPTGSGKSTTLYRGLEKINDGYRKIITIEDPVEYDINGITQIQVKSDIGYDFASGLRAILRQDPDVIMVGEIRDGETATIAAQASLTGHFVLSTLHTNSALAAITRLEDIGLERFLISASVRGLMAQRLVRRLCPECSVESSSPQGDLLIDQAKKTGAQFAKELDKPAKWLEARGCDACDHTGYRGRIAVFEVAKIDDDLREAIINGRSQAEVFAIARKQGFLTLLEDGLLKARHGFTTLQEIHRVCGGDAG